MSQRGIRISDWLSQMCIGLFFFCIGAVFLVLVSADLKAMMDDLVGAIILMLIPVVFMDVGFLLVLTGWKGRRSTSRIVPGVSADGGVSDEKTMRAIAGGISAISFIYLWAQRLVSVAAAVIGMVVLAILWLPTILDMASGKASPGEGLLLALGIVLVSCIVILGYTLLKKERIAQ